MDVLSYDSMRLSSLHHLALQIFQTIRRFPVVSFCAFLLTALSLYAAEFHLASGTDLPTGLQKLLSFCVLGFPLFLAVTLTSEQRRWTSPVRIGVTCLGILFLALYFFFLPSPFDAPEYHRIRYVLLFISFGLAVSVSAFLHKGHDRDFWWFNRRLLQGFALSVIFAGALCAGFFIAMASVDYLFEVGIDDIRYLEVWIILAGAVASQIFLSNIPQSFTVEEHAQWYPTVVRVFAQYILVPLIGLYTLILALYSAKILLTGVWPKGQVCFMVLGYSAAGMLADILLSPAREDRQFQWVKTAGRVYYGLLALFCMLLYGAMWQRIAQYGLTESRYFVVLLGTWILCVSLFFFFRKTHTVKHIPITLFCVLLLSSFGPWSAFNVSKQHQYHRLETVLNRYYLLKDGAIVSQATDSLTTDDRATLSDIVEYLYETHGIESLQRYFSFDLHAFHTKVQTQETNVYEWNFPDRLLKEVGIVTSDWQYDSFRYELETQGALDIGGYAVLFPLMDASWHEANNSFTAGALTYDVTNPLYSNGTTVDVSIRGERIARFDLLKHVQTLHAKYDRSSGRIPAADMRLTDGAWTLLLQNISYTLHNGTVEHIDFNGWLLRR